MKQFALLASLLLSGCATWPEPTVVSTTPIEVRGDVKAECVETNLSLGWSEQEARDACNPRFDPMLRGITDDGIVLIEGDIIPWGLEKALASGRPWPFGIVPYVVDPGYWATDKLQAAMAEIMAATDIIFVPRTTEADYMRVEVSGGCSSVVGYYGSGDQPLRLSPASCSKRAIVHELLHTLGFQHEHSWPGRDADIVIHPECIQPGTAHNFARRGGTHYGEATDFLGGTMYASSAWGKAPDCPTMTRLGCEPWRTSGACRWGWPPGMSPTDIEAVADFYAEEFAVRECPEPPACDSCCPPCPPCPEPEPCPPPPADPFMVRLHDRFEVTVMRRDIGAEWEPAAAMGISTSSAAFFRFDSPERFECAVSMDPLDDAWWIAAGCLSDLLVRFRVVDPTGGEVWEYETVERRPMVTKIEAGVFQ